MPARDGTGPSGQGNRSGRGMGNCKPTNVDKLQSQKPGENQSMYLGGRLWDVTFGRLFRRNRANRFNQKQ